MSRSEILTLRLKVTFETLHNLGILGRTITPFFHLSRLCMQINFIFQKPENTSDIAIGTLIALVVEEGEDWQNVEVPVETAESEPEAPQAAPVAAPSGSPEKHAGAVS